MYANMVGDVLAETEQARGVAHTKVEPLSSRPSAAGTLTPQLINLTILAMQSISQYRTISLTVSLSHTHRVSRYLSVSLMLSDRTDGRMDGWTCLPRDAFTEAAEAAFVEP